MLLSVKHGIDDACISANGHAILQMGIKKWMMPLMPSHTLQLHMLMPFF